MPEDVPSCGRQKRGRLKERAGGSVIAYGVQGLWGMEMRLGALGFVAGGIIRDFRSCISNNLHSYAVCGKG